MDFYRAIPAKNVEAVAEHCDLPFLGGAPHNQRIVETTDERQEELSDDLCNGPYGPFMHEDTLETSTVLSLAEFRERFQANIRDNGPLVSATSSTRRVSVSNGSTSASGVSRN